MYYMDFGSHYKVVGNIARTVDVQRKREETETCCPSNEFKLGQGREGHE